MMTTGRATPVSLARPIALGIAAAIMMFPANLLPVLRTNMTGQSRTDTIMSGIVGLWNDGMWGIAAIVFAASIAIPVLKLAGLSWLVLAVRRRPINGRRRQARLYAILDFIGRWSMLDVFLVAFLAGTVQFGALATIEPHIGILAFAAVVVLTVLATDAFDPRWLWSGPITSARVPPSGPAPAGEGPSA